MFVFNCIIRRKKELFFYLSSYLGLVIFFLFFSLSYFTIRYLDSETNNSSEDFFFTNITPPPTLPLFPYLKAAAAAKTNNYAGYLSRTPSFLT